MLCQGMGVEVGAVWHVLDLAQTIGELAGEHLVDHGLGLVQVGLGLVQVGLGRNHLGDQLADLGVARHGGRGKHRAVQRSKGVGVLLDELGAGAEGAAGVTGPQILGEQVDEADFLEHGALVERGSAPPAVLVTSTFRPCLL